MKDKIEIKLEIEFTAPFHSGTGLASGLIDRGIRRNWEGVLYIPASTFKGTLRNKVEELIQLFYPSQESKTMYLSPNDAADTNFMTYYVAPSRPRPIENLFGSNVNPGQLFFSDLEMAEEDRDFFIVPETSRFYDRSLQVQHRTQTRIYRSLKTVADGALFQSEYGLKGLRFACTIGGYLTKNPIPSDKDKLSISRELFFLLGGLKLMDRIAGNKSIGMGVFTFKKLDVKCNDRMIDINTDVFSDDNFNKLKLEEEG